MGVLLRDSALITKQPFAKPAAVMTSAEDIARFLNEAKESDGDPLLLEAIEAYLYDTNEGKQNQTNFNNHAKH